MENKCVKCGKPVDKDDIGLTKKIVNRGATEYMCKACIAEYFHVSVEVLDEKIAQFKKNGCTLFL